MEGQLEKAVLITKKPSGGKEDKKEPAAEMMAEAARQLRGIKGNTDFAAAKSKLNNEFRYLRVQYNPRTLQFDTSNTGGINEGISNDVTKKPELYQPEKVQLSLELYLDGPDVMNVVNGFFYLMMNEESRRAAFLWGDFGFSGKILQMSPNYSMFDADGNPQAAHISLTIQQEGGVKAEEEYWEKAFKGLFKTR